MMIASKLRPHRPVCWAWMLVAGLISMPLRAWAAAEPPHVTSASEWVALQHQWLRRYLAVVRQAVHDYSYGYRTPTLLMPVATDLFTGCVVHIHEEEARFLYPALRKHMTPEQQQELRPIETGQEEERMTVMGWQRELEQYAHGGRKLTEVADTIDYLARMINRHLVLQEERVLPLLDSLTPQEQAAMLRGIGTFEREAFGISGRSPYEQLLAYIEREIKAVAGRVW